MGPAKLLPAVHPLLPKIRIAEQTRPPFAVEKRSRAPTTRFRISLVDRAEGAIEIPMRAADDLSFPRLVEVSAQHHRVHVSAQHFQHVKVDGSVDIQVSTI